ncbi:MAG: c-type cytochrome [Methyloligellaceae bacterium]
MLKSPGFAGFAILMAFAGQVKADEVAETVKKGAPAYRICAACHSLQPGVHLSGPSLAGLWGKKAASIAGYGRYTEALKKAGIVWDEDTLNAWLAEPQAMVPGTTMMFRGIEKDETRVNLIAFLRLALAEGGAAKAVKEGLIPKAMAEGQIPPSLKEAGPKQLITAIRHCGDAYYVTTAAGAEYPFWETNLRIKIDTSERGPGQGKPILLRSGMAGDRVSVVFPSLDALKKQLTGTCEG